MIPKIIHYCWFGSNKIPKLAERCMKSWKKYCPDYEIKCWNEKNFDVNSNKYMKEAYDNKKYAFVTDYVRLYVLKNYGGVYMDTDVELVKPIDNFLSDKAFSGFESTNLVPTGLMASEKDLRIIQDLLDYYKDRNFINNDGTFDLKPNTNTITEIFEKKGLIKNNCYQVVDDFSFYPSEVFCPIDCATRVKKITSKTYAIHWFSGSWLPLNKKIKSKVYIMIKSILGNNNMKKFTSFIKKITNKQYHI